MTVIEIIKQFAADQEFVDDLAVKATPTPPSFWRAYLLDRKLIKLTHFHDRRLKETYGRKVPGSNAYRGSKIFARYCAWVDLHPDSDVHDAIWPAVQAKLDEIIPLD